jgi:hypothetical protein
MRADENVAAAGRGELHVIARLRHRIVLNRTEAVGRTIRPGKNAEHAGQR